MLHISTRRRIPRECGENGRETALCGFQAVVTRHVAELVVRDDSISTCVKLLENGMLAARRGGEKELY